MTFRSFLSETWPGLELAERSGGTWTVEGVSDEDVRCLAVAHSAGDIFAGTQGAGVWRSVDGGREWRRSGLDGIIVKSLATTRATPGLIVAGLKPAGVSISTDGGATWSESTAFRHISGRSLWRQPAEKPHHAYVQGLAISPTDPDLIVAGMEAGAVVRSTDGGASWSNHRKGSCRDCHSLTFHEKDGTHVYEGGGGVMTAGIAISSDGGDSWTRPTEGLDRKYGWAVAADSERTDVCYVSLSPGPMKAHGARSAEAFIYRSVGLERWEPLSGGLPSPLEHMPYALLPEWDVPGRLYAGLANGDIWQTDDLGESWRRLDLEMRASHRALVGF